MAALPVNCLGLFAMVCGVPCCAVLCWTCGAQAISLIAALLGKTGTAQDSQPRSFAAFRRQRQQQRHLRRQLCNDDDSDSQQEGEDIVEDASSTVR